MNFYLSNFTSLLEIGVALNVGFSLIQQLADVRSGGVSRRLAVLKDAVEQLDNEKKDDLESCVEDASHAFLFAEKAVRAQLRKILFFSLCAATLNVLLLAVYGYFPDLKFDERGAILIVLIALSPTPILATWMYELVLMCFRECEPLVRRAEEHLDEILGV